MKLKKIASLMLAGIMAVSMLAGCGEASSNSAETPDVTPVTGVAATVNGELDKNAKKISFTEDSVLTNLLTSFYKENPIGSGTWTAGHADLQKVNAEKLWDAVEDLYSVTEPSSDAIVINQSNWLKEAGSKTFANIYWVNSDFVTKEDAMRMVGQKMDGLTLPADNKYTDGATMKDVAADLDYTYTGTVAAIEAESKGGTESVWIIVVSITRTVADK